MDAIMMEIGLPGAIVSIVCFFLGIGLTAMFFQMISRAKGKTFEQDLERQVEGAKREAENIIKSAQIDAAAENIKKKEQFTIEANKIRGELHEIEMRLNKREDNLDRQVEQLQQQENAI